MPSPGKRRRRRRLTVSLGLAACLPAAAAAQPAEVLLEDGEAVAAPLRPSEIQNRSKPSLLPDFTDPGSALGKTTTLFGVAGLSYAGGRFLKSRAAQRVGVVGSAALAATGLASQGLGRLRGRALPVVGGGLGDAPVFGGPAAGPADETSMAFSLAAVAADELPRGGDIAVYGLAAAVGGTRIAREPSAAGEVAAGAALGWLIGRGLSRWDRSKGWSGALMTNGQGVYLKHRF